MMKYQVWVPLWIIGALIGMVSSVPAAEPEQKGADFFGPTKVHPIHIEVTRDDYRAMNPPPARPPQFGFGGRSQPGLPAPGSPDAGVGKFNFDFKYVPASVRIDRQELKNVALRYKGNGTYISSNGSSKRSFKLDFNRLDDKLHLDGLKKLNLHCNVTDPTMSREALSYSVFRAAGVPAPRTAFAEVSLTVPGRFDRELLGLYTVVEQVDKGFLKYHFGSSRGLLLKPEGVMGVPFLGDDPAAYKTAYNPKTDGDAEQWKRLVEFTRLVNRADEATFQKEIGSYLDTDEFVRFLAATTMLSTLDSILGFGHNFYLYLSPKTGKFVFLPWDLDQSFGTFYPLGSVERQARLSIDHPHMGQNKIIDRLLAMPEVKAAYHAQIKRIAREIFTEEKLQKEITDLEKLTKEPIARDRAAARARRERSFSGGFGGNPFGGRSMSLSEFVKQRASSALAQLEGREKGVTPGAGFGGPGFGGPGFGGPRPGTGGPRPPFGGPRPGSGGPRPGPGGQRPPFGGPRPGGN